MSPGREPAILLRESASSTTRHPGEARRNGPRRDRLDQRLNTAEGGRPSHAEPNSDKRPRAPEDPVRPGPETTRPGRRRRNDTTACRPVVLRTTPPGKRDPNAVRASSGRARARGGSKRGTRNEARMHVVDTSELKRPTQRKLHAAWRELHGRQVLATVGTNRASRPLAGERRRRRHRHHRTDGRRHRSTVQGNWRKVAAGRGQAAERSRETPRPDWPRREDPNDLAEQDGGQRPGAPVVPPAPGRRIRRRNDHVAIVPWRRSCR